MIDPEFVGPVADRPIRAECFLLCDHVRLEHGKLYILGGGWTTITPDRLPLPHSVHLAIKLAVPESALASLARLSISVVDADGRAIDPAPINLNVGFAGGIPDGLGQDVPVMIPVGIDLTLVRPGTYTLHLSANGDVIAQTSFRVAEPRPVPSAADAEEARHPPRGSAVPSEVDDGVIVPTGA